MRTARSGNQQVDSRLPAKAFSIADDTFSTLDTVHTMCIDYTLRLLVVVYTWRKENTIRIISARKAMPKERSIYEKEL